MGPGDLGGHIGPVARHRVLFPDGELKSSSFAARPQRDVTMSQSRNDLTGPVTSIEKREAQRRRVLKEGTIAFSGMGMPCTVRDISESGAALIVHDAIDIPKEFLLAVVSCRLIRSCRLVWRQGRRLGAAFLRG